MTTDWKLVFRKDKQNWQIFSYANPLSKNERTQINKITNARGDNAPDTTDKQQILRDYCE